MSPDLSLGKIMAKIEAFRSFLDRFSFHLYCNFLGSVCFERIESLYYRTMHQSGVVLIDVIWLREDIIILQHASLLSLADFREMLLQLSIIKCEWHHVPSALPFY